MSISKSMTKIWRTAASGYGQYDDGSHVGGTTVAKRTFTATDDVTYDPYTVGNWRQQIKLGRSATTSLNGRHYKAIIREGHTITDNLGTHPHFFYVNVGDTLQQSFGFPALDQNLSLIADNKARSKLLAHYLELVNTWRGGNFFAEIRESINMLRHPVESFYRETWNFAGKVGKLGKVYKKRPIQYGKALADAWLAYAFGAKPFAQDCNDAAAVLNKLGGSGRFDLAPLGGFGRETTGSVAVFANPGLPVPAFFQYDRQIKSDLTVRYRGKVKCALPGNQADLENCGLGVFDIVPAVWEAIPWSFFIDYFANVGEVIDGYRLCAVNLAWMNRTVRNSTTINQNNVRPYTSGSAVTTAATGSTYALSQFVSRGPSGLPAPNLHFQKVPGIDSLKWLNTAALARQVLGSKPK
jgi:hypothetical protein